MINVILCGGSGTRLWPLSRQLMPKQFVHLLGERSLFQETVLRNSLCPERLVVSNAEQYFLAADQLDELADRVPGAPESRFVLEPTGRNTAPALALACLTLDPEEIVLATPSDHLVRDKAKYEESLREAERLARLGFLVTFGIKPAAPETGYGYIQAKGEDVVRFVEKPDLETAKLYLESGDFLWNSGMFCFKAGTLLRELEKREPAILGACEAALKESKAEGRFVRIPMQAMLAIPSKSIDYAVMEKSDCVKVVPSDFGWNDLGSFESLYAELPRDDAGNTLSDKHISVGSTGNLSLARDRVVATVDLHDSIVVDTSDALLVAPRGKSQQVKSIVEILQASGSELASVHTTASRPWGKYTVLREGEGYKIKRIAVKPGARLSLQKHRFRSEHWVVLSGVAKVTNGDEVLTIRPNESTYIPAGRMHRLENPGTERLEIVEVQVGSYVGEDDIERFDDDYKRG